MPAEEKNYGQIFDTVSWTSPIDADRTSTVEGCQRFHGGPDAQPGRPHSLARAGSLALYVRSFADGGGENGLHSHDDDAAWLVVAGGAEFFTEGGVSLGELAAADGLLVPAGTSYRFVCHGPTTMMRVAARSASA
jgi:quercetin dioxygenase-like cupin family protein